MEILLTGNAKHQITSVLFVLAKRFGKLTNKKEIIIEVPLTHRIIGTFAGLSRESTSIEMEKLTKSKIISKKNGLILINNLKKLEEQSLMKSAENIIF